jgi:hypothetical protein
MIQWIICCPNATSLGERPGEYSGRILSSRRAVAFDADATAQASPPTVIPGRANEVSEGKGTQRERQRAIRDAAAQIALPSASTGSSSTH